MLLCLHLLQTVYAQTPIPDDPKAKELLDLGKKYLRTGNAEEAALTLEQVDKTKFNTRTTAAIFLSGIAWLETGNKDKALSKFNRILNYYSESRYVNEARYHKALLLMNGLDTREFGLKMMMDASDQSKDRTLQGLAKDAISKYLYYEADIPFLVYYLKVVRESYKNLVAEALAWQYLQAKQFAEIMPLLNKVDSTGKRLSPRLKAIQEKCAGLKNQEIPTAQKLSIAILMPFFANEQDSANPVSSRSLVSTEFLEGMQMAVQNQKMPFPLELELVAFDVRRDSALTRKILNQEFAKNPVDVIVGSYFNNESRVIADWCEQNKIVHIVPYSPETYLGKDKKYVHLASPSLNTHARKLADYAVNLQGYKKIAVFSSDERITKLLAEEFVAKATALKAETLVKKYSINGDKAQTQIPDLVKQLSGQNFDAVYIPDGNEEIAGMILSNLKLNRLQMAILGSPEFRNFRAIDKELMDNFLILFSDAVYEMNKPEESEVLVRAYAEEYNQRLTLNVMRGYDLMNWLMQLATQADTKSDTKESWIKKKEPFRGINQNFRFENYPDNQAVFILRMEGRTIGKAHEY
jgi:ABC-type branched-subunit amino acid transport system substrate-binding protein